MNNVHRFLKFLLLASVVYLAACSQDVVPPDASKLAPHTVASTMSVAAVNPESDPTNKGGWILREDISDEFSGTEIDRTKWFVQGDNDEYYIWKGRAPSQFAPHNIIVEDGKLKIRSQWEPGFDFAVGEGHEGNDYAYHEGKFIPVTTGAVITHKRFLNGYMEVRSKAVDAAMTSAFWMIGYESELDVYEQMGRPKLATETSGITETSHKASVHDWRPPGERPTRKFGYKKKFPHRIADDFHVYGVDWGIDYLKFYIDGELVYEVTQEEVGRHWVLTNPLEVWLDSEIFVWLGLPDKEELPDDFEIDYMRVWQKPDPNLLDRAFFGFEGPFLFQDQPRPLKLEPPSSEENDYQKFWSIAETDADHVEVVRHETFSSGTRSLKISGAHHEKAHTVSATAPTGTVGLEAGEYTFAVKIFVEPGSSVETVQASLASPETVLPSISLTDIPRGEWVTVERKFKQKRASNTDDFLTLDFQLSNESPGTGSVYIDDISITGTDRG